MTPLDEHAALQATLLEMPPVAALQPQVLSCDNQQLTLWAPLAANANNKGCAFGGSLDSLMTVAAGQWLSQRLAIAGIDANVFLAHAEVRYRAPLFADLLAQSRLAPETHWETFLHQLHAEGKASAMMASHILLPEGGHAAEARARFVAVLKPKD